MLRINVPTTIEVDMCERPSKIRVQGVLLLARAGSPNLAAAHLLRIRADKRFDLRPVFVTNPMFRPFGIEHFLDLVVSQNVGAVATIV